MGLTVTSLTVGVAAAVLGFAGILPLAAEVIAAVAFAFFAVSLVLHLSAPELRIAPGDEVE